MNISYKLAMSSLCLFIGSVYANSYETMKNAIRQSDYAQIKEIIASTTFLEHEKTGFISLADETVQERKTAIENRAFNVRLSLLLKITSPLTFFGGIVGYYIDPRALAAILALPTTAWSIGGFALILDSIIKTKDRQELLVGTLLGASCTMATYGLIKLEQYFWKRAKKIDQELQQALEKAIDCKNLLFSIKVTA